MAWLNVLVLFVTLLAGNVVAPKPRILSGFDADIEAFPYQASLRLLDIHICSGTIVSERHIVTAAHCIFLALVAPYEGHSVVTGTGNRFEGGKSHKVINITVHPNFTAVTNTRVDRYINDIAIITLLDKIVFDKYQQILNLPEHDYQVGQKVNLTGWVSTKQSPLSRPERLQKLELDLLSREECQQRVIDPDELEIFDTEVCINDTKASGTCIGDGGGPLASNDVLVGVASWMGGDRCGEGHPDVFANVYEFKDFINNFINSSPDYVSVSV